MKNLNRRLARKRIARGVTLIEVLIVIAIMSLLSAAAAFAVISIWKDAQKSTAKLDAQLWRQQVGAWRMTHPSEECPTVVRLRADKISDKQSNTLDPWGTQYSIVCEDDDVTVISAGPDKKIGTPDDIVAPPQAKVAHEG
jgi:prepilin-type N-terminal cleavage/methylation domain-containing protein